MRFGIWSSMSLLYSSLCAQSTILNQEQPLNIAISITFASKSHVKYLLEIAEVLSQRGHKITYLSMNQYKKFADGYNVTHYSLGNVEMDNSEFGDMRPFTSKDSVTKGMDKIIHTIVKLYDSSYEEYEKYYKEHKPDLMICDYAANSCTESAAMHALPMITGYQSLLNLVSTNYMNMKGVFEPTTIENYSFLQRFKHGFIDPMVMLKTYMPLIKCLEPLRRKRNVPEAWSFPVFGELGLAIANSYIGFELPRKIPSHVNVIGPILSEHVPKLPDNLQTFLDDHSKLLYVAFGSMVHLIPELTENLLQHFQRALNEGIVDGILWGGLANTNYDSFPKTFKVSGKEYSTQKMLDGTHDKIQLLKWAPQESILQHPNTRLFFTHGGLDSIYESLRAGTPMLVIPFLGDQPRNAMLVTENGVGDYIEWPTMGDEVIYQKFVKLLDSNNLQLQSKVRQLQLITKFSSKRKLMAADLIETYAYSAKSCRQFQKPKPFEIPCEMKPFLPLDYKVSSMKANLIDVYIVAVLMIITVTIGSIYLFFKLLSKYFTKSKKQKSE